MQTYTKRAYQTRGIDVGSYVGCECCGKPATEVHHIDGRLGKLLNDPKNLIFICRTCHHDIHSKQNDQEVKAKLKKIVLFNLLSKYR